MMFFAMCAMILVGHKFCKGINDAANTRVDAIRDKSWASEKVAYENGFVKTDHLGNIEYLCHHENTLLGQMAVIFLFLTVLKTIIPKAQQAGERRQMAAEANAKRLVLEKQKAL